MKKLSSQSRTVFFLVTGLLLAFLSMAFGSGTTHKKSAVPTATPVPTEIDITLEVGSTDGILVWAVLITLIIVIPAVWKLFLATRRE